MPPTLDIPQPINDLRIAEYGDRILIEFSILPQTTEGLPLTSIRSLDLRIGPAPENWNDDVWAASAKAIACSGNKPGAFECFANASDTAAWIGKEVVIRARATGPKGKTSLWSPVKTLPVQPPLATPADLNVDNTPAGLSITWKSPATHFRVFRAIGDGKPELKSEPAEPSLLDPDVDFGTRYQYFVQAIAGQYQQSDIAQSQPKTRVDDFVPTAPSGLTAQQSANAIELSWERNTDARFQGYNVYRSVNGGTAEKIASLITTPAYSDRQIEIGKKYVYRITAVGLNGRESVPSAPFEIPAQ